MSYKKFATLAFAAVLAVSLTVAGTFSVFASDVTESTDYEDGLVVDGSTGWNTSDGDNYLVTEAGTVVTFTNTPFVRDSEDWSNFVFETIASSSADGITLRADAYGWTYTAEDGVSVNTPWYYAGYDWDWDDFQAICTENTEVTLTAQQTDDTTVLFTIEFGTAAKEFYEVTYEEGVPDELWFRVGADGGSVEITSVTYLTEAKERKEIVSISAELPQDSFATLDDVDYTGTVVTLTYEDGTTEEFTVGTSSLYIDSSWNWIHLNKMRETYTFISASELGLVARASIYCDSTGVGTGVIYTPVDETPSTVVITELDEAFYADIDGTLPVFSYTPEEDGYYIVDSEIVEGDTGNVTVTDGGSELFYFDDEGNVIVDEYEGYWVGPDEYAFDEDGNLVGLLTYSMHWGEDYSYTAWYLEAGRTYCYQGMQWMLLDTGTVSVTVTQVAAAETDSSEDGTTASDAEETTVAEETTAASSTEETTATADESTSDAATAQLVAATDADGSEIAIYTSEEEAEGDAYLVITEPEETVSLNLDDEDIAAQIADITEDEVETAEIIEVYAVGDVTFPVTLTFSLDGVTADNFVALLHYVDGAWQTEDATVDADGNVTATFSSLSPLAFIVTSTGSENPEESTTSAAAEATTATTEATTAATEATTAATEATTAAAEAVTTTAAAGTAATTTNTGDTSAIVYVLCMVGAAAALITLAKKKVME